MQAVGIHLCLHIIYSEYVYVPVSAHRGACAHRCLVVARHARGLEPHTMQQKAGLNHCCIFLFSLFFVLIFGFTLKTLW